MRIKGVFVSAILAAVLGVSGSVLAVLSGSGTEASPYLIQSRADFDEFANPANAALYWASGKYTQLICNLNLSGTTYIQAVIAPDTSTSSGFQGIEYIGCFDGNGHLISNLTINQPTKTWIGFFGSVGPGGQVKNLGVTNVCITGYYYVGGLVAMNSGAVTSCYASGSVAGTGFYIGGLVGGNDGVLASCYFTGLMSGSGDIAGLVGANFSGTISYCYANGSFNGSSGIGGLVGDNYYGTPISSCFWNIETTGQSGSSGGKGLTTSQMKTLSIFQNAGWGNKGWVIINGQSYPHLAWENIGGVSIPQPQTVPLLGSGSEQTPFQIWTAEDFVKLSWHVDILDKHIVLMNDLDLSGVVICPIGDLGSFTGVFDGNGCTIINAFISQAGSDCVGLFGIVGSGGQIKNLGVENINITGRDWVGGLIGRNDGTVTTCHTAGSISSTGSSVGGLAGWNGGLLTHSYVNGSIQGVAQESYGAGGAAGVNGGTVVYTHATGSVSGYGSVGGLIGSNSGPLSRCYATGMVNGINQSVGGLVGAHWNTTVTLCYATGAVVGCYSVGGLIGYNSFGNINFCYATGPVSATGSYRLYFGGLVGVNSGVLTACYATGLVSKEDDSGGLVGATNGTQISCFWDMETSGQSESAGGKGLTTEQMHTMSIYQNAGWMGKGWMMDDGQDYPRLFWENVDGEPIPLPEAVPLAGAGSAEYPYLVATAEEFALLSWYSDILNKHIKLTADLELSGTLLYPIGDLGPFTGVFDGDGNVINNAMINQSGSKDVGLFGIVGSGGQIKNLGVNNIVVIGYDSVGGLVGENDGLITGCYTTGSITGINHVGGLIGHNRDGTINTCYSTGVVSGNNFVGGIVGTHQGTLISCYSTGIVDGYYSSEGGIVGCKYDGSIAGCFWDRQTSGQVVGVGQGSSAGTNGKTTTEMMTLPTFTGWDFSDTDGDAADWMILRENEDYPRLAWQEVFAGDIAGLYGVDGDDLLEVVNHWLEQGCPAGCEQADMDGSGTVDLGDFVIFSEEWMEGS